MGIKIACFWNSRCMDACYCSHLSWGHLADRSANPGAQPPARLGPAAGPRGSWTPRWRRLELRVQPGRTGARPAEGERFVLSDPPTRNPPCEAPARIPDTLPPGSARARSTRVSTCPARKNSARPIPVLPARLPIAGSTT